mmetsp:Transcript_6014/g.9926  ORF Transcript_6014/g.9926 Transcript_6014/m.9926 type:complete len:99 (-) Transcript_6014:104-400(-)
MAINACEAARLKLPVVRCTGDATGEAAGEADDKGEGEVEEEEEEEETGTSVVVSVGGRGTRVTGDGLGTVLPDSGNDNACTTSSSKAIPPYVEDPTSS